MNILQIYRKLSPNNTRSDAVFFGGAQKMASMLATYIVLNKNECYFASDDSAKSNNVRFLEKKGVKHYKIEFDSYLLFILTLLKLIKFAKNKEIEIIHCHDRRSVLYGFIVSKILNLPMIYTARNVFCNKKMLGFTFGNNIIAISEGIKNNLINYFKINPDKVQVIYNGIEINESRTFERDLIKKEFRIENKSKIISVIARLSEQKGHIYLFKALVEVIKNEANLIVLLVGDGPLKNDLMIQAKKLNLENNVMFCGIRSQVAAFIDLSMFCILPTLWEGLPSSIVEAMLLGKPVIASNIAGVSEVISNMETGILVESKNDKQLKDAIVYLLNNPSEINRMGENAKVYAKNSFSPSEMYKRHREYYANILQKDRIK